MLRDAEFFSARINQLDGAGDLGDSLVRIVKDKSVAGESNSTEDRHPTADSTVEESQTGGETS